MNKLSIFLLLLITGVTTSQGGNRSVRTFYCKAPGCADNVTVVYCHDKLLLTRNSTNMGPCTGPPPPNSVCQHGGRAFVSIDTDGTCEFEKEGGYIWTERCTDHSNICAFISATTPSPVTTEVEQKGREYRGYIAAGVCSGLVVVLIILGSLFCKNNNNQQPASGTETLREIQIPGETSMSGPVLENGSSPQCDREAYELLQIHNFRE